MGFNPSETANGAPVFALISSTSTPSAISTSVSPFSKSTSNTPNSVMILETQVRPVSGNTHSTVSPSLALTVPAVNPRGGEGGGTNSQESSHSPSYHSAPSLQPPLSSPDYSQGP